MNKYLNNIIKKVIWVLPFCLFTFLPSPVQPEPPLLSRRSGLLKRAII